MSLSSGAGVGSSEWVPGPSGRTFSPRSTDSDPAVAAAEISPVTASQPLRRRSAVVTRSPNASRAGIDRPAAKLLSYRLKNRNSGNIAAANPGMITLVLNGDIDYLRFRARQCDGAVRYLAFRDAAQGEVELGCGFRLCRFAERERSAPVVIEPVAREGGRTARRAHSSGIPALCKPAK